MYRSIRVVLADDHVVLRALQRGVLSAIPGIEVVGEAGTGREAIALTTTLQPDVLVLDITLAGGPDGVDVATALAGGPCKVLACSAHDDPVLVASLLQAGAAGYLSKDDMAARLGSAVRAVAEGRGRWFGGEPRVPYAITPDQQLALQHFADGGRPGTLAGSAEAGRTETLALCDAFGAVSWYEAVARAWGAGLIGGAASRYSTLSNVPGHANSASTMSYGA